MDESDLPYKKSPHELLAETAARTLLRNRECLVAVFFRKFPQVDPSTVTLVSQMRDGRHYFWIEFPRPNGKGTRTWTMKERG
jgi:hypothetical protein